MKNKLHLLNIDLVIMIDVILLLLHSITNFFEHARKKEKILKNSFKTKKTTKQTCSSTPRANSAALSLPKVSISCC